LLLLAAATTLAFDASISVSTAAAALANSDFGFSASTRLEAALISCDGTHCSTGDEILSTLPRHSDAE
jgi:hypothetical protein